MRRFKLGVLGKILVVAAAVAVIGGAGYMAFGSGLIKDSTPEHTQDTPVNNQDSEKNNVPETKPSNNNQNTNMDSNTINLSLDEWIGWKPIIDANMGLKTQPDSIFGKLGLDVNINIINDATQSSNALVKGDLNAAGYTTNRLAFLSQKFKESGTDVVMPVYTNYSNGGDGIIALSKYNSVESLVDAKIAVPRFSEAHTLVVWFVQKSDLTQEQKDQIINNLVMFDTPDDAAKAFFAGQVDAAATWQPYLSQAESSTDSHILFSTASSNKLIMDGIVFRKDWAESHSDLVTKFIDGIFQAESMYSTEMKYIREVMPMFATMSDEDIIATTKDAGLANYANNVEILNNDAPTVFTDMCDIWESVGETVNRDLVNTVFDSKYLMALEDKYSTVQANTSKVQLTDEEKATLKDVQALMTKTSTINFMPDTAKFLDNAEAANTLNEFISIAKTLDGTIIQIEGNINASIDTEEGRKLSEERAKTVANYFIANGIDPNRIIVVGNGNTKMIGDMNTEEGKIKNRRTDVFFKTIEE